jgi:sialidase-1
LALVLLQWNDIVMRRSTNGGRSWLRQALVHGEGTSKKHVCIGNPSPVVVHSHPGRIVMTGTREVNEGFSVTSTDWGSTWAPAVYQPSLVARRQRGSGAPRPAYGQNASAWTFYMPWPAAGLQLPSGRLVVGAYHGVQFNKSKQGGEAFSFSIYSDDLGSNWSWVDGHAYDVGPGTGECQIAPAPNGSFIMRTRTGRHRPPAFAWSSDGTSWSKPLYWTNEMMHADIYQHYIYHECSRTKPVVCKNVSEFGPFSGANTQGSIARLPGSELLVTSAPFASSRANMTLWVSSDSGASWRIAGNKPVFSGYSGYSALVGLNATHVGLLWEVSGDPPAGNPPGSGSPFHLSYTVVNVTA